MTAQDGAWRAGLKGTGRLISTKGRDWAVTLIDLLIPPMAHDSREATAFMGLSPTAWSRISFLEDPVCDGCGTAFEIEPGPLSADRCEACQAKPFSFARARAACLYDEASRSLILRYKHGDHQAFAPLFANWIGRAAAPLIAEADAIVPVPLHPLRLLKRRFNQAAEIARPLARQSGLDYLPDSLRRIKATASQGGRSASARRRNVAKAFAVPPAHVERIVGRRILLVDDVFTTGATAEACARVLLKAGAASVHLAVIARVQTRTDIPK